MSTQLIFDPAKVMTLKCPFSFFIRHTSGKKISFQHEPFSVENLQSIYFKEGDYDPSTLKTLALLTKSELRREQEKHAAHYRQLNPRIGLPL